MKALSVRAPWPWLITRPDVTDPVQRAALVQSRQIKDIENRDWATRYRGRFLIHAALGMTHAEYDDAADFAFFRCGVDWMLPYEQMQRGGIVGIATLIDCVTESTSPWFMGRVGFVLADAQPLPFFPCKGRLQFFEVGYPFHDLAPDLDNAES
jgi:hypothetical protein